MMSCNELLHLLAYFPALNENENVDPLAEEIDRFIRSEQVFDVIRP